MLEPQVNKRSNPRSLAIFPISITKESGKEAHPGIVRDISKEGVFFYSKVRPELNAEIEIAFMVPDSADYKRFVGRGMVVRVEDTRSGLIGIAARLSRCEIIPEKPASAQSIPQVWTNAAVR